MQQYLPQGIVFCIFIFLTACSGNPHREITTVQPLPEIKLIFCLGNVRELINNYLGKSVYTKLNGYSLKISSFNYQEKPFYGKEPVFFEATERWTAPTIELTVPQTDFDYRICVELGEMAGEHNLKEVYCSSLEAGTQLWLTLKKEELGTRSAEHKSVLAFPLFLTPAGENTGLRHIAGLLARRNAVELYAVEADTGFSEIDIGNTAAADFFILSDGTDLKSFDHAFEADPDVKTEKRVQQIFSPLAPLLDTKTGFGNAYTARQEEKYWHLKDNRRFHWVVRELDENRIIACSANAGENVIAASISKVVLIAAALYHQGGKLQDEAQWRDIIILGIKSWCSPWWDRVEELAGGTEEVNRFTAMLGLPNLRVSRYGGNLVNALELSEFYYYVLHNKFAGAEVIYKLTSACETGPAKGRKYMPAYLYLGGKTGFWQGFNHDSRFFKYNNHWYAIVVLTTDYTPSEELAIVFGGVFREYVARTIAREEICIN
jgi:hypothetical protein